MRQVMVTLSQLEAGELAPLVAAMLEARAQLTRTERNISIATGMLFANRRIPPEGAAFVQLEGTVMLVQLPDSAQLEGLHTLRDPALHTPQLELPDRSRATMDLGAPMDHTRGDGSVPVDSSSNGHSTPRAPELLP